MHLASGKCLEVFFKDYSSSSVPRKEGVRVGRREIDAYRFLRAAGVQGLPKLYGWVWDTKRRCYWLLSEHVGNCRLQDGQFQDWIGAIRWLGRLHGQFVDHESVLKKAITGLRVYNRVYYLRVAQQAGEASQASSLIDDKWAKIRRRDHERLQAVLEFFPTVLKYLVSEERTLLHGDCYSHNILLRRPARDPKRRSDVYLVDWEMAVLGPGAVDLLGLLQWWEPPESDILIDHYLDAFRRQSGRCVERRSFDHTLKCSWIYDTLVNVADLDWSEGHYRSSRNHLGLAYRLKCTEQFMQAWPG